VEPVTKDIGGTEVLGTFFASVFTSKVSPQTSEIPNQAAERSITYNQGRLTLATTKSTGHTILKPCTQGYRGSWQMLSQGCSVSFQSA